VDAGISKVDASELAGILASESPQSKEEPFGKKAKAWIVKNIGKAANGTWKVGVAVATNILRYYGFK
jgi:3-methyladenine DNA glycosylase AlkD